MAEFGTKTQEFQSWVGAAIGPNDEEKFPSDEVSRAMDLKSRNELDTMLQYLTISWLSPQADDCYATRFTQAPSFVRQSTFFCLLLPQQRDAPLHDDRGFVSYDASQKAIWKAQDGVS